MARVKPDKAQNSGASIGEKLKKARESKGASFEEVYRATKIHHDVLQGLEEDRLNGILGRSYAKAFLKKYAEYLGLDSKEIVAQYASRYDAGSPEKQILLERKPLPQPDNKIFIHSVVAIGAFVIWMFILGFVTVKFVQHFRSSGEKEVIVAVTDNKPTTQQPNKPKQPAIPKEPDKPAAPKEVEIENKLIPIPKNRTITLTVLTDKDVWLKVMQDGKVAFHGNLSKNSKETWKAKDELLLSEIGRPEALRLNVNGSDMDLSEKRLGRNILITHKGIDLDPKP